MSIQGRLVATIGVGSLMLLLSALPRAQDAGQGQSAAQDQAAQLQAIAKATAAGESVDIPILPMPPTKRGAGERIDTEPNPQIDYQEYVRDLRLVVSSLDQYWRQTLPGQFKRQYTPPARLWQYGRNTQGIPCNGVAPGRNNAYYCGALNLIQWDTDWFVDLYRRHGDFSIAFILAHEWGHAMQHRLDVFNGQYYSIQIERQADCFAGAWTAAAVAILDIGDVDEAVAVLLEVGDKPGVPWFDKGAHGTPQQRIASYRDGLRGGPQVCFSR